MRIKPIRHLIGRLRPTATDLRATIYIPFGFLFIRPKTFDLVGIYGGARKFGNIQTYLAVTEEYELKQLTPISTQQSETVSTTDAFQRKDLTVQEFTEDLIPLDQVTTEDTFNLTFTDVLTLAYDENLSLSEAVLGGGISYGTTLTQESYVFSETTNANEPYSTDRPEPSDAQYIPTTRFFVLEDVNGTEYTFRNVTVGTGSIRLDITEGIVLIDKSVGLYEPPPTQTFAENGFLLLSNYNGPYEVNTIDGLDYLNPPALGGFDIGTAKPLLLDKVKVEQYLPVVKSITENLNLASDVSTTPEFEVYQPAVLIYSFFEEAPPQDIFQFVRTIPDYDNNRLINRFDFPYSIPVTDRFDYVYIVPPVHTLRFKETVEVKEESITISYKYTISRDETVTITEQVDIKIKVSRISELETVDVNDVTDVRIIAFNFVEVQVVYTNRATINSPTIEPVTIEVQTVSTNRVLFYPAYYDRVIVTLSTVSTNRATI